MPRTLPKRAGARLVLRRARYKARKWATHKMRTNRYRLSSTVRAALMSGNLMTSPSGSAGSSPTNTITITKTRMKMMPPRIPASPPHRRTLFSSSISLLLPLHPELPRTYLPRASVNGPFGFASHGDDDFSLSVSFFEIADGLGDLAQRVRPVDHRCEGALLEELLKELQVLLVWFHCEASHLLAHER